MTPYRHTQVGTLVFVVLAAGIASLVTLLVVTRFNPIVLVVAAVLLLAVGLFQSLTVAVTEKEVRVRFGIGPIGRVIPVSSIRRARVVRNPWYYGWGIRWFPGGWLFNVSGFDAVELVMTDGRLYRIGTDEPDKLLAAINRVCQGET